MNQKLENSQPGVVIENSSVQNLKQSYGYDSKGAIFAHPLEMVKV
jgi:hypothetical protein